jgi:hypothetical protein
MWIRIRLRIRNTAAVSSFLVRQFKQCFGSAGAAINVSPDPAFQDAEQGKYSSRQKMWNRTVSDPQSLFQIRLFNKCFGSVTYS